MMLLVICRCMEVHCSAPPATKPKRSDIKMAEPMEIPAAGTSDDGMYKFFFYS